MLAAVRMAFDARKLILAAGGLLLLHLGWSLLDLAFPGSVDVTPDVLTTDAPTRQGDGLLSSSQAGIPMPHRLFEPARILIAPLSALVNPRSNGPEMLHALLGIAWLMAVWGLCGGAIARIAAIQDAQARQPGIDEAFRFAWRSARPLILVPSYPLVAVGLCSLTGMAFGLLYRLPAGPAVTGALLFIPLAFGLMMTFLIAALIAGWPLFHAAVASGADDALDALSRTYSYLNQRLATFAFGLALAGVIGLAGLALVDLLADGIIHLTRWSLSLSGPRPLISALFLGNATDAGTVAVAAHRFWLGAVRLLAHAWIFSYFWTAAAILYLWLRCDVDGTPTTVIDPPGASMARDGAPSSGGTAPRPDPG